MNSVRVDLSFRQLEQALRRLSPREKIALWRLLDEDIDRASIARKFTTTVAVLRKTYSHVGEAEVMKDAVKATRGVRRAKSRT